MLKIFLIVALVVIVVLGLALWAVIGAFQSVGKLFDGIVKGFVNR